MSYKTSKYQNKKGYEMNTHKYLISSEQEWDFSALPTSSKEEKGKKEEKRLLKEYKKEMHELQRTLY